MKVHTVGHLAWAEIVPVRGISLALLTHKIDQLYETTELFVFGWQFWRILTEDEMPSGKSVEICTLRNLWVPCILIVSAETSPHFPNRWQYSKRGRILLIDITFFKRSDCRTFSLCKTVSWVNWHRPTRQERGVFTFLKQAELVSSEAPISNRLATPHEIKYFQEVRMKFLAEIMKQS